MTRRRRVTANEVGQSVEIVAWASDAAGVSVLVSPAEWAQIVARVEGFASVRAYRAAEAKLAHSHGAKGMTL